MESIDDFYLVLPSNSSMSTYPDNTTSCYTTRLPREIRLSGEWLVGLAEIHVPCTATHFQKSEANYFFHKEYKKNYTAYGDRCFFPFGLYGSVDELASEINEANNVDTHQVLEPLKSRRGYWALTRICDCPQEHATQYNQKIRTVFGFEAENQRENDLFVLSDDINQIIASRPASLARSIPDQLFVYTDACEPYTVGDTHAGLLRVVSLDTTKYIFGSNIVRPFGPVHYIPVLQHQLQTITIDIRDQFGKPIPFQYGTSMVTLHFIRNTRR